MAMAVAMVVAMEAWVMAMAVADLDMATAGHIAVGDTNPTDSTEQLQDPLALFRLIQLVPSMTFPLQLHVY